MSDGNEAPNPRPAKDLKGLLRFCMEATRREDAQGSEIIEPMTEDRKKWLEEAFIQMSVSPVERMSICVSVIENAEIDTEEGTEQQIKALDELQDWAEDVDIAGDFIKINGLRIVPGLLASEVSDLRWNCLELLANLSQNNPTGQTAVLSLHLMPAILLMIDTDPNPTVRVKALYALSCLVRSNTEAQGRLKALDGLSVLVRALSSEEEKIRIKATFLISSMCGHDPSFKDALLEKGAVEQLVYLLKTEGHSMIHEHLMSALLAIVTNHKAAQERCLREDMDVRSFLCERLRLLSDKEEFQEEREHADKLLQVLNSPTETPSSSSENRSMSLMLA
ncbi:hsp70-binding protein 1 isoform X1 [Aplysia californica]|uniref:Hsp70-binding protein 1 isoform X1 n=1 Tax=Aplysia californica TaxID=6500 RepID=A0ABM1W025_APLCA|nr:hsp70-binding protein 1 isoform X1 [Aplysia californica]XP_035828018.1 hsp70-binding protein 1 isoform X1 [Aplysia californica]XP_035828019.1 hsp70-binding protein 1 isoform X1 [Aplysia californica]